MTEKEKRIDVREEAIDKMITKAKDKVRQRVHTMSYADLLREFKKALPRIDKYLKELS